MAGARIMKLLSVNEAGPSFKQMRGIEIHRYQLFAVSNSCLEGGTETMAYLLELNSIIYARSPMAVVYFQYSAL